MRISAICEQNMLRSRMPGKLARPVRRGVLPERLRVPSVQAERPLRPSRPLLIRGFGVRVPGGAPVLNWGFIAPGLFLCVRFVPMLAPCSLASLDPIGAGLSTLAGSGLRCPKLACGCRKTLSHHATSNIHGSARRTGPGGKHGYRSRRRAGCARPAGGSCCSARCRW